MQPNSPDRRSRAHFSGCLLGGAVGDALGAPVEFLTTDQICAKYGPAGIADYDDAYGRRGAITDDTQMTLFTAEGVLRADVRWHHNAAITHGHPSGYYSAGCFTAVVHNLVEGRSLPDAIERTLGILDRRNNPNHAECATAIRQAVALSCDADLEPSPETIERMGGGWVGEEALAIALYCALVAPDDFARGVQLAVNHSGDSDSTGAIAGNLLGLMLGIDAIPPRWLDGLELREEIATVAEDLYKGFDDSDAWFNRYPGW